VAGTSDIHAEGSLTMKRIHSLSLAAAISVLVAQPAQLAAQADCRMVGCNSKYVDQSDQLPGLSDPTVLVIGAVVVVGAFVAWRLLRSDPTEAESQALRFGVANEDIYRPELTPLLVSPGLSFPLSPVSCRESPRACLYQPAWGLLRSDPVESIPRMAMPTWASLSRPRIPVGHPGGRSAPLSGITRAGPAVDR